MQCPHSTLPLRQHMHPQGIPYMYAFGKYNDDSIMLSNFAT